MLYLMCIQYRNYGTYNNYNIDDILIDKYNFSSHNEAEIIGNHIIACTFWKYDDEHNNIFMNYLYLSIVYMFFREIAKEESATE